MSGMSLCLWNLPSQISNNQRAARATLPEAPVTRGRQISYREHSSQAGDMIGLGFDFELPAREPSVELVREHEIRALLEDALEGVFKAAVLLAAAGFAHSENYSLVWLESGSQPQPQRQLPKNPPKRRRGPANNPTRWC
jgi:hypothetical protein